MIYKTIVDAVFEQRPNRFIAHCCLQGQPVVAHVKNTGRCKELLQPGVHVYLQDHRQDKGQRKTDFSLIAVEKPTEKGLLLINMDSQAPNQVAQEGLLDGKIRLPLAEGEEILSLRREVSWGSSRFDLQVKTNQRVWYVEVKGVTLEESSQGQRTARFPDAPTERGVKHIRELIRAKEEGYGAAVLFLIQMKDVDRFQPNWSTHAAFGQALQEAQRAGVAVLAYDCHVAVDSFAANQAVTVDLSRRAVCAAFSTEEEEQCLKQLDKKDHALLTSIHHGRALEQSKVTQALMKRAAAQIGFSQVTIERSEKGAPICKEGVCFVSASHTEGCKAAVASEFPVGIDAEAIGPVREKVLSRFFSMKEQDYVNSQQDRDFAFTLLWTLKEAYGKMTGLGLPGARSVEFEFQGEQIICNDPSVRILTKRRENRILSVIERLPD